MAVSEMATLRATVAAFVRIGISEQTRSVVCWSSSHHESPHYPSELT